MAGGLRPEEISEMQDLRAIRDRVVRQHMEAENVLDFATAIETFAHPRYELIATGQVLTILRQLTA